VTAYLLDTTAASDAIRGYPAAVRAHLVALPTHSVAICAITQGELLYRLAKQRESGSESAASMDSVREATHAALRSLTPREEQVLRKRFGIDLIRKPEHRTLEEIEKQFKAARERVLEIQASVRLAALAKGSQALHQRFGISTSGDSALEALVHEFLIRVQVLPWTAEVANVYGELRASCEARDVNLGALDMLIAAQAVASGFVLVTREKAFSQVEHGLQLEDWST
jgi:predicted nucleic acid-binding protein